MKYFLFFILFAFASATVNANGYTNSNEPITIECVVAEEDDFCDAVRIVAQGYAVVELGMSAEGAKRFGLVIAYVCRSI